MAVLDPVISDDLDEIVAAEPGWQRLQGSSILVTGASGMLPSYVALTLLRLNDTLDLGVTVTGLVRNGPKAERILAPVLGRQDFQLLVQDVAAPVPASTQFDHVVHGASAARPALHGADPVGTMRANLLGTMNLLDAAVERSASVLLMSSAEVYGAQPAGTELIAEDSYGGFDILNPRACYSEGKRAAETLVAAYAAQHGVTGRIARLGHIYGPGLAPDDGRVQAEFASHVVAGKDIVLSSDGSAMRTYTYVGDAVAGMFRILLAGPEVAYNVADPAGLVSIRELAEIFSASRPDKGVAVRTGPPSDQATFSRAKAQGLDSSRLRGLGWEPRVSLSTGIDRMVTSFERGTDLA